MIGQFRADRKGSVREREGIDQERSLFELGTPVAQQYASTVAGLGR